MPDRLAGRALIRHAVPAVAKRHHSPAVTRAELVRYTGLSKTVVQAHLSALVADGELVVSHAPRGNLPALYAAPPEARR